MKRLIVNADDFGRSDGVNAGTLEAHRRGIVTSATLMVLEHAAAGGVREARARGSRLSLGLHFALTGGGRPAAPVERLPVLAPDGRFRRSREDLPERLPEGEVREELEAQIGLFERLAGGPPSHLDSHHHVALHPSAAPVVAAVAHDRSLPVRAPTEDFRAMARRAGLRTPDFFVARFYGEAVSRETLEELLRRLPEGTSELMCHPGFADEALRASSAYVEEREREVAVLCDASLPELIRALGIVLVGYDAL